MILGPVPISYQDRNQTFVCSLPLVAALRKLCSRLGSYTDLSLATS